MYLYTIQWTLNSDMLCALAGSGAVFLASRSHSVLVLLPRKQVTIAELLYVLVYLHLLQYQCHASELSGILDMHAPLAPTRKLDGMGSQDPWHEGFRVHCPRTFRARSMCKLFVWRCNRSVRSEGYTPTSNSLSMHLHLSRGPHL